MAPRLSDGDARMLVSALRTHGNLVDFSGALKQIPVRLLDADAAAIASGPRKQRWFGKFEQLG